MSILSEKGLIENLGKEILFHPLKPGSVRVCNLCLTASQYAYSLGQQKKLEVHPDSDENKGKKYLQIPANDTVLIWTDESIWLSQKFCASLHSTVSLVSQGIGHIGTRINPNWCGVLSIAFHNLSTNPIRINIEDPQNPIAYLMIHKLTCNKSKKQGNVDGGARLDILEGLLNTEEIYNYYQRRENRWMRDNVDLLKLKMIHHDQYIKLTDNFWKIAYREVFNEQKNIGLILISLFTFLIGRFTMSNNELISNIANIVGIILGVLFVLFLLFGLYKFITNIINKQISEENG